MVVPENLEQVEAQQKKFDDFNKELSVQENRIKVRLCPHLLLDFLAIMFWQSVGPRVPTLDRELPIMSYCYNLEVVAI